MTCTFTIHVYCTFTLYYSSSLIINKIKIVVGADTICVTYFNYTRF